MLFVISRKLPAQADWLRQTRMPVLLFSSGTQAQHRFNYTGLSPMSLSFLISFLTLILCDESIK